MFTPTDETDDKDKQEVSASSNDSLLAQLAAMRDLQTQQASLMQSLEKRVSEMANSPSSGAPSASASGVEVNASPRKALAPKTHAIGDGASGKVTFDNQHAASKWTPCSG